MEKRKRLSRQNKTSKTSNFGTFSFNANTHIRRILQALLGKKFYYSRVLEFLVVHADILV